LTESKIGSCKAGLRGFYSYQSAPQVSVGVIKVHIVLVKWLNKPSIFAPQQTCHLCFVDFPKACFDSTGSPYGIGLDSFGKCTHTYPQPWRQNTFF